MKPLKNEAVYLLKIARLNEQSWPRLPRDMPSAEKGKLMRAWQNANLQLRQHTTRRVAVELGRLMASSPMADDCKIKEVFENIGCISVRINDAKKAEILGLLFTHKDIQKRTVGHNAYTPPPAKNTSRKP